MSNNWTVVVVEVGLLRKHLQNLMQCSRAQTTFGVQGCKDTVALLLPSNLVVMCPQIMPPFWSFQCSPIPSTASSGHPDGVAYYFFLQVSFYFFFLPPKFPSKPEHCQASKKPIVGSPSFQGSAAAKNPVKLNTTAFACPHPFPGPCLFDSFAP